MKKYKLIYTDDIYGDYYKSHWYIMKKVLFFYVPMILKITTFDARKYAITNDPRLTTVYFKPSSMQKVIDFINNGELHFTTSKPDWYSFNNDKDPSSNLYFYFNDISELKSKFPEELI